MGFNFPNSPTNGQTFTPVGGYQYVWDGVAWRVLEAPQLFATAESRNRVVNGAFQINQEAPGVVSVHNTYICDQWQFGVAATTGAIIAQASNSAAASRYYVSCSNSAGDASLAAGAFTYLTTKIEGLQFTGCIDNTNLTVPLVLGVRVAFSVPGTYGVSFRNAAVDRSWVGKLVATDTADHWYYWSIPAAPFVAARDNSAAAFVTITCRAGTTFQGVEGWQNGNILAPAGTTNLFATANQNMIIRSVGLWADPDNTGIAPPFQIPDEAEELRACQRYWVNLQAGSLSMPVGLAYVATATSVRARLTNMVPMRSVPALSGALTLVHATNSQTPTAFIPYLSPGGMVDVSMTTVGATTSNAGALVASTAVTLNARM